MPTNSSSAPEERNLTFDGPFGSSALGEPAARPARGRHARRSRRRPPVVVILDDLGSEHFHQLACTLRRRGIDSIKITTVPGGPKLPGGGPRLLHLWRERLTYGAHTTAAQMNSCAPLQDALAADRVLDVLANEITLATVLSAAQDTAGLARRALAFTRLPPEVLTDKYEVNALLGRAGVLIPRQFPATELAPAEAAQALGLPLLVKRRVSLGGMGVRIAHSIDQVEQAVAQLGGDNGRDAFYQEHIEGQMVAYGAVRGASGPLLERGLLVSEPQTTFGPSARIRLVDEDDLIAAGRRVATVLGCLGFAEIGFMRDAQGRLWHVDANCRSWGNMQSLLCLGIDFVEPYRALLLGLPYSPHQDPRAAREGAEVAVLPYSLFRAASQGPLREFPSLASRFAVLCGRGPGPRYAITVMSKVGLRLASRLVRALSRPARFLDRPRPRAAPKPRVLEDLAQQ